MVPGTTIAQTGRSNSSEPGVDNDDPWVPTAVVSIDSLFYFIFIIIHTHNSTHTVRTQLMSSFFFKTMKRTKTTKIDGMDDVSRYDYHHCRTVVTTRIKSEWIQQRVEAGGDDGWVGNG